MERDKQLDELLKRISFVEKKINELNIKIKLRFIGSKLEEYLDEKIKYTAEYQELLQKLKALGRKGKK